MKKMILACALSVFTLSLAQTTTAQSITPAAEERCTSSTVNMFGTRETMTVCSDGSGSLRRQGPWGSYDCLIVWNSSRREIYNNCQ